jgi:hypothetical protein
MSADNTCGQRQAELELAFLAEMFPHCLEPTMVSEKEASAGKRKETDREGMNDDDLDNKTLKKDTDAIQQQQTQSPFSRPFCPMLASSVLQLPTWQRLVNTCVMPIHGPTESGARRVGGTGDSSEHSHASPSLPLRSSNNSSEGVRKDMKYFYFLEKLIGASASEGDLNMSHALSTWDDLKRVITTESTLQLKHICTVYLSCIASAVSTYTIAHRSTVGDEITSTDLGSSALRNAVICAWIGLSTSGQEYSAVSLICHCMRDEEVVLIAECCVDILSQHQHGLVQQDDVTSKMIMRNQTYKALMMEFLAVCMMAWTAKGLFRSDAVDENGSGVTYLRMLWVSIQYTRFIRHMDSDTGNTHANITCY